MNHDLKERLECASYAVKEDGDVDDSLLSEALARIEQLEADLEKARKALEPFADEVEELSSVITDSTRFAMPSYPDLGLSDFTVGHLRTAAQVHREISR